MTSPGFSVTDPAASASRPFAVAAIRWLNMGGTGRSASPPWLRGATWRRNSGRIRFPQDADDHGRGRAARADLGDAGGRAARGTRRAAQPALSRRRADRRVRAWLL